ncbi:MAG TPA: 2-C-methyl-D-erythritol 4-phosphate cytidylyltransferase [Paludibacter sp.]|nr:2-C-methyl-D-erythritol 4-phosphate cytidylyltransferase [Paludibacter sp.]HOS46786.1 2-C-methyl-D-erythritol 4-phosphate cytidylyltransferase [Paludibacter sp.]
MSHSIHKKPKTVIIVAGGTGKRMQADIPKQFIELKSKPILMHTIEVFVKYDHHINIIVVLPENQMAVWKQMCKKYNFNIAHQMVAGGATRFDSVKNGLELAPDEGLVAVHDGVRPLVSVQTIHRCFEMAERTGTAIPVIDIVESIRKIEENDNEAVDRNLYKAVQTPQVFEAQILKAAYRQDYVPTFTDDASVVEAFGHKISIVEGNKENIKITTPLDLGIGELFLV